MPTPPAPQPRYINSDIVMEYLAQVVDIGNITGTISQDAINNDIALAESEIEQDLQTFVFLPFQTLDGRDWTFLSPTSYTRLYNAFRIKSALNIYKDYLGITNSPKGNPYLETLHNTYVAFRSQVYERDKSGNYTFPNLFKDMKRNNTPAQRSFTTSYAGNMGGNSNNIGAENISRMPNPYLVKNRWNYWT